ncbi:ABC transporter substrate-binding protein [Spirillospora sp. CA-128828]|uniref:ABC transporter substrate-binding protein n=1 Tax=Spirillospora sp. CA-128828 TaxID=3240033 RepID=UPI003D92CA32
MRLRILTAATALLAAGSAALVGCSSDTGVAAGAAKGGSGENGLAASSAVGELKVDTAARDLLPDGVRKSNVLKVGGSTDIAPYLSVNGKNLVGVEADFMTALGRTLGVKFEVGNTKFAAMVPGLQSRRFDVAMADFSDTLERQKQVTFVDYTRAGQILIVPKGNPLKLKAVADLCGHSAAGPTGSLSVDIAMAQSKKCTDSGEGAVNVQRYPTAAESALALQSGRIDTLAIDYGIASSLVQQSQGKLQLTGGLFGKGFHGAAFRKDDQALQKAFTAAFTTLMKNGTYKRILDHWNLPQMSLDKVVTNGATE